MERDFKTLPQTSEKPIQVRQMHKKKETEASYASVSLCNGLLSNLYIHMFTSNIQDDSVMTNYSPGSS